MGIPSPSFFRQVGQSESALEMHFNELYTNEFRLFECKR